MACFAKNNYLIVNRNFKWHRSSQFIFKPQTNLEKRNIFKK